MIVSRVKYLSLCRIEERETPDEGSFYVLGCKVASIYDFGGILKISHIPKFIILVAEVGVLEDLR